MDRTPNRRSAARSDGLIVRSHWSAGLRTPAWDRLWRAILSDLGPKPVAISADHLTEEDDGGRSPGVATRTPVRGG
jgi:hypothetical protein